MADENGGNGKLPAEQEMSREDLSKWADSMTENVELEILTPLEAKKRANELKFAEEEPKIKKLKMSFAPSLGIQADNIKVPLTPEERPNTEVKRVSPSKICKEDEDKIKNARVSLINRIRASVEYLKQRMAIASDEPVDEETIEQVMDEAQDHIGDMVEEAEKAICQVVNVERQDELAKEFQMWTQELDLIIKDVEASKSDIDNMITVHESNTDVPPSLYAALYIADFMYPALKEVLKTSTDDMITVLSSLRKLDGR